MGGKSGQQQRNRLSAAAGHVGGQWSALAGLDEVRQFQPAPKPGLRIAVWPSRSGTGYLPPGAQWEAARRCRLPSRPGRQGWTGLHQGSCAWPSAANPKSVPGSGTNVVRGTENDPAEVAKTFEQQPGVARSDGSLLGASTGSRRSRTASSAGGRRQRCPRRR